MKWDYHARPQIPIIKIHVLCQTATFGITRLELETTNDKRNIQKNVIKKFY